MEAGAVTVAAGHARQIDLARTQAIDQPRHVVRPASVDPTIDPTIFVRHDEAGNSR
jgi:hypothetical protein